MNELLDKPLSKNEFYSGMDALADGLVARDVPRSGGSQSCRFLRREGCKSGIRRGGAQDRAGAHPERRQAARWPRDRRTFAPYGAKWLCRRVRMDPVCSPAARRRFYHWPRLAPWARHRNWIRLRRQTPKRYMHHYNFPPFSTGEVKPLRGQSRREVGHGALAERALEPVIPAEETFPVHHPRCI